jgi:hypothetical protein
LEHKCFGDLEKRQKQLRRELEGCRREMMSKEQISREGVLCYRLEMWKRKWTCIGDSVHTLNGCNLVIEI